MWGDVAEGAVEAHGAVVRDPLGHEGASLLECLGLSWPDRVGLDGAMEAFNFAVGLRVVG